MAWTKWKRVIAELIIMNSITNSVILYSIC